MCIRDRYSIDCNNKIHELSSGIIIRHVTTYDLVFFSFLSALYFQVLCRSGVSSGILPCNIPFGTEIIYTAATSVLFHLGSVEPTSLKPSYFTFMRTITGQRFVLGSIIRDRGVSCNPCVWEAS